MAGAASTLAAFVLDWDVAIRGILVTAVAIAILAGSVYLLLGTNLGNRLGFLVAAAGFFAWMSLMGIAWWVYAIGLTGEAPSWDVEEIVISEEADDLSAAATERAHEIEEWRSVPEGNPTAGEAQAAAEAALVGEDVGVFESSQDFAIVGVREVGGKGDSFVENWFPLPHPTHFAVVQVQRVIPVVTLQPGEACPSEDVRCITFGETPPPPEIDEAAPVVSVVMVRDLGSERLPPAIITLASLSVFGVLANHLHRRDRLAAEQRQRAEELAKAGSP